MWLVATSLDQKAVESKRDACGLGTNWIYKTQSAL